MSLADQRNARSYFQNLESDIFEGANIIAFLASDLGTNDGEKIAGRATQCNGKSIVLNVNSRDGTTGALNFRFSGGSTLVHEIGHALYNLDHVNDIESVMLRGSGEVDTDGGGSLMPRKDKFRKFQFEEIHKIR